MQEDEMRFNNIVFVVCFAVGIFPVVCLAATTHSVSNAELERMKSKYAASANTFIPQLMEEGEVPGMQIAVIQDGLLFYQGAFGVTNAETHQRVDAETVFAAASLGKPVFAYAVLKLACRGEFDLDQPLAQILPFAPLAKDPRFNDVTARMVLSHTGGLPHSCAKDEVMLSDPSREFHYSPAGYDYLQQVITQVTGLTLNEFVTREVFRPLGMSRSAYYFREDFAGNSVYGHSVKGPAKHVSFMSEMQQSAACSLLTTAADYAKFLQAMLKPEDDCRELVEEMLTPQIQVREDLQGRPVNNLFWGVGWGLELGNSGKAFWHWGDMGMIKNYTICQPAHGFGLVYFTNGDSGLAIGRKLTDVLNAGDSNPFDMLGIENYDAPGWKAARQQQRSYLNGDVSSGKGLYF
jgi:CubicO group peptidase (beta-lactamase class C family)